jgi:hypothetical protein
MLFHVLAVVFMNIEVFGDVRRVRGEYLALWRRVSPLSLGCTILNGLPDLEDGGNMFF